MIPRNDIIEWSEFASWQSTEQVEQDLVISRSLVELFSDEEIRNNLSFRGGTAIHKLFFHPQPRYSEDIDLVQVVPGPFGYIIDRIREVLSFIGEPKRSRKHRNNTLIFRFNSEIEPVQQLRLKVETNCREHDSLFALIQKRYEVKSSWYEGICNIPTCQIEELIGTKLRALYQRKKGRDLYDIYKVLDSDPEVSIEKIIRSYRFYMEGEENGIPDKKIFIQNVEDKINDPEFLADTSILLRPAEHYNPYSAFKKVREVLLSRL